MKGNPTSPLVERARFAIEIKFMGGIVSTGPKPRDVDPIAEIPERDLDPFERDLDLFEAVCHELALDAAEDPRPNTPEEDADVAWLMARARQRMSMSPAEIRAQRTRTDSEREGGK